MPCYLKKDAGVNCLLHVFASDAFMYSAMLSIAPEHPGLRALVPEVIWENRNPALRIAGAPSLPFVVVRNNPTSAIPTGNEAANKLWALEVRPFSLRHIFLSAVHAFYLFWRWSTFHT